MKIGYDGKRAFHNFRGLGNYSRLMIEGLDQFAPQNQYHLFTPDFKSKRAIDWQKSLSDQVITHTPKTFLSKISQSLWRRSQLAYLSESLDLDIFHGLSHELPIGIERTKVKSIVSMHDLIFLRYPEFFPWIDRLTYKRKFSHSVEVADCVLAICEQTKKDLIEFLNVPESKIKVHYQSCDPHFYNQVSDELKVEVRKKYELPKSYILSVGAIEQRKNALSLVMAFDKIKDKINEDLVLVGNGKAYKEQIEDYILKNNLDKRVRILHGIPFSELPAFYQMANLFCFPSHFEGFGIPLIESLFGGTPVLTSMGSCFPETVGEEQLFIDPNRIESIEDGLLQLLTNEDLRLEKLSLGMKHVEKFRIENTTKKLLDLYREV